MKKNDENNFFCCGMYAIIQDIENLLAMVFNLIALYAIGCKNVGFATNLQKFEEFCRQGKALLPITCNNFYRNFCH